MPEQKGTIQRLMASIAKQDGLATYSLELVLKSLQNGEVEVALVTDTTDMTEIVVLCKKCALSRAEIVNKDQKVRTVHEMTSRPCERCGAVDYQVDEKDMIDVLEDAASQTNARVEVVSSESEEKVKLTALGGFAALLRFKLKQEA